MDKPPNLRINDVDRHEFRWKIPGWFPHESRSQWGHCFFLAMGKMAHLWMIFPLKPPFILGIFHGYVK